ncbi:hypothetical protein CH260_26145 [Rhodococcus sp. 05-2256-B2]|uniref:hypothetical protein n=1 Tax=unclassified Rhodococcus (in: high G+C Gram-positive bacteria) TaxID=192944 RepID=UPI000B9B972C|nr:MULTISPECIES: hypothetical protein [unclassified Rhodococcus (in: high G+C Gram-positive bacteria)]OZD87871.1 hypothetical protein CH260_26145 [Rhodococcus sp. 05-2256-B2]OZD92098.1 hypothetical protein CH258_03515 [Rhodococcus sp. 05-2256-B4]OZD99151.1 hypothetical protein CH257_01515 [Rhodococcus sp. 05-2256-B3]OZE08494.1 hypothetical protein CH285_01895 [Rhodococcus sp. 05-2256-B1]
MTGHSVRPEDILPDGAGRASFDGLPIRKGTVAAFVANARALRDVEPGTEAHGELIATLKELAPQLAAIGVLEVFEPRDPQIAHLVDVATHTD